MQPSSALPRSLRPLAAGDEERFTGLVDGLQAANLHAVAKAVREERANLIVPSHALYGQNRLLAGRAESFSPIYVTPKGSHGARRCTVAGELGQRPPQTPPPLTPSAMYSSPYLLRQFVDSSSPSVRPRTAMATATSNAWHPPMDVEANKKLYERHRAAGNGWRSATAPGSASSAAGTTANAAPVPSVDFLDVEAEKAEQLRAAPQEEVDAEPEGGRRAKWDELLGPVDVSDDSGPMVAPREPQALQQQEEEAEEEEEVTPPNTAGGLKALSHDFARLCPAIEDYTYTKAAAPTAAPPPTAGVRRSLNVCRDAATFYERNSALPVAPVRSAAAAVPAPRPTSARAIRLDAQRSDIFGHSVDRGHWTVGPVLAGRGAAAAAPASFAGGKREAQ